MRTKLKFMFVGALALALSVIGYSQTSYYKGSPAASTTLAAAITSQSQTRIQLTSCSLSAGGFSTITSVNPTWAVKVDDEIMTVANVINPTTCLLEVVRGSVGTRASTHGNGQIAWATPLQYMPSTQFVLSNAHAGLLTYSTVPIGSVAYSSLGNDAVTAQYTLYAASVTVPNGFFATGIAKLNGSVVGTDNDQEYLLDVAGNLIAQTGSALSAGANAFQSQAFTPGPVYIPAGQYFLCVQSGGTTAHLRTIAASTYVNVVTTSIAGTALGTLPAWSTPTTFTANVGPIAYLY